jgi:predicted RNA binding protein YcfA (HicA-like mRNA interferase family)
VETIEDAGHFAPDSEDGWYQVAQRGSHRQFKHPEKPGRVTIAGHPSDEMDEGTRKSIFKQAGIKP